MSKIIIVEDDPMISEIYQKKFSDSGFEVFLAENGKVALDIVKKEKVGIVLADLIMPNVDGYELTKKLRSENYDQNIKIVVMSNLGKEEEYKRVMELGANGFIAKSEFTPAEMVNEVKKIISA